MPWISLGSAAQCVFDLLRFTRHFINNEFNFENIFMVNRFLYFSSFFLRQLEVFVDGSGLLNCKIKYSYDFLFNFWIQCNSLRTGFSVVVFVVIQIASYAEMRIAVEHHTGWCAVTQSQAELLTCFCLTNSIELLNFDLIE